MERRELCQIYKLRNNIKCVVVRINLLNLSISQVFKDVKHRTNLTIITGQLNSLYIAQMGID